MITCGGSRCKALSSRIHHHPTSIAVSVPMVATTRSRSVTTKPSPSPKAKTRKQSSPGTSAARSKRSRPSPPHTPTKTRARRAKSPKQQSSRLVRSKPKLPSEYELGSDGLAIVDQLTSYPKLSEFGQRVLDERRNRVAEVRAPRPDLDNRLRPRFQGIRQPMLHFGLACNTSDILACAERRDYVTPALFERFREEDLQDRVWTYLRCRQIDCTFERILSTEYEFVVALYSNYDQFERQLVEEDEEACLRFIRSELNLGDQAPMWYWDDVKCGTYYTAPLPEYNVPNLRSISVPVEGDE
ncbi:hypothetical protein PENSPDRAFT_732103 [Peniophora sp. CONT]|nr:hypothetical protein PENSPDRAFT_732103 [Peniophora sp. CONT]